MPKVAVWSLPSLSEASRKSQGKCPADGQRWPKADGQGRLSGRCKPQRHFFSDALPLQLLGVGGYIYIYIVLRQTVAGSVFKI